MPKVTPPSARTPGPDANGSPSHTPDSFNSKAVIMAAYLIRHRQGQHGDILADDVDTLDVTERWATFSDQRGIAFAIPIDHIASIQRVDEPQDDGVALTKE